jgi:flagellin FlaB
MQRLAVRLWREQDGITGLETAIVLIAFVVVSSVFAYTILNMGMFSADRSKEAVNSGLSQTRSNLELKGAIVGIADAATTKVESLKFYIGTAAGAEPIDFQAGTLVLTYQDAALAELIPAASITITAVGTDNGDNLLDAGETREVTVTLPAAATLDANKTFTMEIRPRIGAVVNVTRTTPLQVKPLMNLN